LTPFHLGQKEWKKGVVVERLDERSYKIEMADGSTYRRNRFHLRKTNEPPPGETISEQVQTPTHYGKARAANESPSGSTLTEPPQVPSYSDEPDTHTHPVKGHLLGIHCILNHAKRHTSLPRQNTIRKIDY